MTILLLAGSPSSPSRSTRLLGHVGGLLQAGGHVIDQLDVRDLPAQALLHAEFSNRDIVSALLRVAAASAVVVATPVYKAAYAGTLKAFLDLLPQTGLAGKLVLPIATGGSQSHMLALDYALRPVLSALGARHVLPSVYATDAQVVWTEEYGLKVDDAIVERLAEGVDQLGSGLRTLRIVSEHYFSPIHFSQVLHSI
jgi:FMN reductase